MSGYNISKSTIERLYEWGRWARTERISPHYGSTLGDLKGSTVPTVLVNQLEAEQIDSIVSRLKNRTPMSQKILKDIYVKRRTIRSIAIDRKISKPSVEKLKLQGEAWVDAAIEFKIERVA